MRINKLFTGARRRSPTRASNAVVVCIERASPGEPRIRDEDVDALAARLRSLVLESALGDYDGCDSFSSESRLYFFSQQADRLAAAVTGVIAGLPWRDRVLVRVSLDPAGDEWRCVDS